MTTRIAAPVIVTVSLAALLTGGAGPAAANTGPSDYLRPAQNAAAVGLARGHVIVFDYLSPSRGSERFPAGSVEQAVQAQVSPPWTAEARRELHAQAAGTTTTREFSAEARRELHSQAATTTAQGFGAEARRELKGSAPVDGRAAELQGERLRAYAEARAAAEVNAAEMQGERLRGYAEARTDAEIRELKSGPPVDVNDDLSPLGGSR
ncbi:hypothetical protein [Agromyces sp. NPDC049794]|uniref:hypothetical protein n=1 Tax=unclassified Agromyces TaxID=2639701 RepID=UPI0033C6C58C